MLDAAARLLDDPIVALGTGSSRSALGVVRLSGQAARLDTILAGCVRLHRPSPLLPGRARRFNLVDPRTGEVLDEGLILRFSAPRSYTGEDVVELSLHGNPVVLEHVLEVIQQCGARAAGPGEFTRRAVMNGKLSLLEAEGVGAIVEATSRGAAKLARRQLGGQLAGRIETWKLQALEAAAAVEALIDFPEEVEESELLLAFEALGLARGAMQRLASSYEAGRALVRGWNVVLTGPVNAGKSTLFNALLDFDRAIISSVPGTTRDVVSEAVEWGGVSIRIEDTAGIRGSNDPIEQAGIQRSGQALEGADLRLDVRDGRDLLSDVLEVAHRDGLEDTGAGVRSILVATHGDLIEVESQLELGRKGWFVIEPRSPEKIEALRRRISSVLGSATDLEDGMIHTARQQRALQRSAAHLVEAERHGLDEPALSALSIRASADALEEFLGRWEREEVLDTLFARFCIGK